ncbi:glycoside hydrolase family 30 beta sandwich domain-containing protein [Pseudoduganella plicata]|nr:glycoside hydrolase family 30 beta sandwich domain-containing protein [Pseudoduganella plicata]GGY87124.1 glucosylceramidase [Pseudoduganella plicata]
MADNGDGTVLLARQPDLVLADVATPDVPTPGAPAQSLDGPAALHGTVPVPIDVDAAGRRQLIAGFGVGLSDASAWLIRNRLDEDARKSLLRELFDAQSGLGLRLLRLAVGSSEFARDRYSLDDVPPGQQDPNLAQLSIERDREAVLPVARSALAVNPALRFVAAPHSAPGWMKSSDSLVRGTLRPEATAAYARYLRRFVDLYREEGVPVFALTLQHQPRAEPADAPGMLLDAAARVALAGQLAPGPGGTRILELDDSWDAVDDALKVLGDPAAQAHLAGTAWHCYGGDVSAQTAVHDAYPGKEIYLTECSGGTWAPGFGDGLVHFGGTAVVGAVRNWATGIMLGNLALDEAGGPRIGGCAGCRGLVTIGADGGVVRHPEYYALAHASRFVRPDAVHVTSTGPVDGVSNAAFANADGSLVLVVVNAATVPRDIRVRTAERTFGARLSSASMATYVWNVPE